MKPKLQIEIFKKFNPQDRKIVEKIFNVNLKGRHWTINSDTESTTIRLTFHDYDNCFGWNEILTFKEFFEKLKENKLYLDIGTDEGN